MGLLEKLGKANKDSNGNSNESNSAPYIAKPNFYQSEAGAFGVIPLTEGTLTALPQRVDYSVDGKPVSDIRLAIVSSTLGGMVAVADYRAAITTIQKYSANYDEKFVLVNPLSFTQIRSIVLELKNKRGTEIVNKHIL